MIRRIDPDEPVVVNGKPVTGRALAEARQQLAHDGSHLPTWAELTDHDREVAALSAGGWLRALTRLAGDDTAQELLTLIHRYGDLRAAAPLEGEHGSALTAERQDAHAGTVETEIRARLGLPLTPDPEPEPEKPARYIDLDSTSGCPLGDRCASCDSTVDLQVVLATTAVGIYCLTLCWECEDAGKVPEVGSFPAAIGRVAAHCAHLGIDVDAMAAAIEREETTRA